MRVGGGPTTNLDWLYEVRNARAFYSYASIAGVAAEISHLQILNPVGSGKTVFLYLCSVKAQSAGDLGIAQYDTALTTVAGAGLNMKLGAAVSVAQFRQQTNPAPLGSGTVYLPVAAATLTAVPGTWLFMLTEGKGVVFRSAIVNDALAAFPYWVER